MSRAYCVRSQIRTVDPHCGLRTGVRTRRARRAVDPNRTEQAPLPRLPPHIHRDRHTVHIRDTRLCRNEPGYRCPDKVAELSTGAVPAGTRSKLGSKLTIQIRIQTHAQIRADAVHQGTLRTRVARAHKSGDAFRLWPV
jgi:hypothetical protein